MAPNRVEVRLTDDVLRLLKKLKGSRSYSAVVTDLIVTAASPESSQDLKSALIKAILTLNRILEQEERIMVEDIVLPPVPSKILRVLAKEANTTKAKVIEDLLYNKAQEPFRRISR